MNEPDKFYDKELPYFDIQLNKHQTVYNSSVLYGIKLESIV